MIIETKYDPGDVVWIMINNKPTESIIYQVQPGVYMKSHSYQTKYTIEGYNSNSPTFYEKDLFKTKTELINSF
jgi:hypothetical protein